MKRLLAILALFASAPAAAAAPYTIYSSSPTAGQPLRWTVNRADVSSSETLELKTKDETAIAGQDYQATDVAVIFAPQQVSATILIPTTASPTKSGQKLTVGLILSKNGTALTSMVATIAEPTTTWVSAQFVDDGYARCKTAGGCHAWYDQTKVVAQQGDVMQYRWNGVTADASPKTIGAFWPIGHDPKLTKNPADWYLGYESLVGEWEAVALAN